MDNNYVGSLDEEDTPEINSQPSPAFDDLRGIEFTSEPSLPAVNDPEPTTYRAPIDFELGTTAATGIEVEEILLDNVENQIYDDEYETEDETDYKPQSGDIPIDISEDEYDYEEDGLAGYDPVPVLLVGTPEKVRLTVRKMSYCANNSFKNYYLLISWCERDHDRYGYFFILEIYSSIYRMRRRIHGDPSEKIKYQH